MSPSLLVGRAAHVHSGGMRTRARTVAGATLGAIVIVLLIVAGLAGTRVPARDPSSPEGAVQAYLTALLDGRTADAAARLDPAGPCTAGDLDTVALPDAVRVDLIDTTSGASTAQVRIRIVQSTGDPFGGSWSEERTLRLQRIDAEWRITGIPWPLGGCARQVPA